MFRKHEHKHSRSQNSVKILVIGESDVGKSCFVHLICHGRPPLDLSSTIGCNIEITKYEFDQKSFLIELWDIGGRIKYRNNRSIFGDDVDGVIFVHDLSNKRSMTIETWMHDVFFQKNFDDLDNYLSFEEMSSQLPFPIMVVGNKSDLISNDELLYIEEMGISNINISTMEMTENKAHYFQSTINMFFERCIIAKLNRMNNLNEVSNNIDPYFQTSTAPSILEQRIDYME